MNAEAFEQLLHDALVDPEQFSMSTESEMIRRTRTFEEFGMLTRNRGLVVTLTDGSQFEVTIVQRQ